MRTIQFCALWVLITMPPGIAREIRHIISTSPTQNLINVAINSNQADSKGDGVRDVCDSPNLVYMDVARSDPQPTHVDTLYVGGHYEARIWLANDSILGGIRLPFELGSSDGATWKYLAQPDGYGPLGVGSGAACITVEPDSRLDPPDDAFDMTGLLVTEYDMDMQGDDSIIVGGMALLNGLQPGPSEHMLSLHFSPTGPWIPGFIGTLCFDTCMIPPGAFLLYVSVNGYAYGPVWGGPICLPVKILCGNPNGDNSVNIADAVFLVNYIFRGGPAPDPLQLGDANCDGAVDVADAVYLLNYVFKDGPEPCCP